MGRPDLNLVAEPLVQAPGIAGISDAELSEVEATLEASLESLEEKRSVVKSSKKSSQQPSNSKPRTYNEAVAASRQRMAPSRNPVYAKLYNTPTQSLLRRHMAEGKELYTPRSRIATGTETKMSGSATTRTDFTMAGVYQSGSETQ